MAVGFVAFWAVLVFGRFPAGMFNFLKGYMTYSLKTAAYFPLLLTDHWSPNVFHPLQFDVEYPEGLSRWLLLFVKLPSYLLGVVLSLTYLSGLALLMLAIPAWFSVLVTGKYPEPLFRFSVSLLQWGSRVGAWQGLMRDDFSLFGTTRAVQVPVAIGAAAFLFVGLSPWLSISVPGASYSPWPPTAIKASQLETMNEGQRLVEEFLEAG